MIDKPFQWTFVIKWAVATGVGWLFAHPVVSSVGACIALATSSVVVSGNVYLYFAVEGAVLGLMQWLVLRRQLTSASWWIVASTIGWLAGGLGTVAAGAVYNLLSDDLSDEAALVVAHTAPNMIGGALCGVVTSVSLAVLLRKQKSHA